MEIKAHTNTHTLEACHFNVLKLPSVFGFHRTFAPIFCAASNEAVNEMWLR